MSSRWDVFEKFRPKFGKRGIFIRVSTDFVPRIKLPRTATVGRISTGNAGLFPRDSRAVRNGCIISVRVTVESQRLFQAARIYPGDNSSLREKKKKKKKERPTPSTQTFVRKISSTSRDREFIPQLSKTVRLPIRIAFRSYDKFKFHPIS